MSNCKKCNNQKRQQPSNHQQPKREAFPLPKATHMEIHLPEIPSENDFVTIPIEEYSELISIATIMDTTIRWAKAHSPYDKIQFNELLLLLGANEEDGK